MEQNKKAAALALAKKLKVKKIWSNSKPDEFFTDYNSAKNSDKPENIDEHVFTEDDLKGTKKVELSEEEKQQKEAEKASKAKATVLENIAKATKASALVEESGVLKKWLQPYAEDEEVTKAVNAKVDELKTK